MDKWNKMSCANSRGLFTLISAFGLCHFRAAGPVGCQSEETWVWSGRTARQTWSLWSSRTPRWQRLLWACWCERTPGTQRASGTFGSQGAKRWVIMGLSSDCFTGSLLILEQQQLEQGMPNGSSWVDGKLIIQLNLYLKDINKTLTKISNICICLLACDH